MKPPESPFFSIITVVYNGEEFIEKTIQSVTAQNFPAIEYIVWDGKSSDNTLRIAEKYAGQIDLIISEKDSGVYDAMNKAVNKANGEWILFLNAGDVFCSNLILENVYKELKNLNNHDLIYGDVILNDKVSTLIKAKNFTTIQYGMPFCHQSVFVNKRIFELQKFNTHFRVCADYDFFLKMFKNGNKTFKKVNFPISVFDVGGISYQENVFKEYFQVAKSQFGNFNRISTYHYLRFQYKTFRTFFKKNIISLFK